MDYKKGKIYKIESSKGNKIYIGSTTKDLLSQRMDKHRSNYKAWKKGNDQGKLSSFILFDEYGVENCKIILIESFPCNSKDELRAKEAYYIKEFIECVNKVIPNRTRQDYYLDNKEKKDAISKKYYADHSDKHQCLCGGQYTTHHKKTHERSKKHILYLTNLQNLDN
jgi:hypothetical protein